MPEYDGYKVWVEIEEAGAGGVQTWRLLAEFSTVEESQDDALPLISCYVESKAGKVGSGLLHGADTYFQLTLLL
jgi:hypothetical protein